MLLPALLALLSSQDTPPKPPPPPPERRESPAPGPEQPALQPGVIPAGAGEAERGLWQALVGATLAPNARRAPITAFDLSIDVKMQSSVNQSNAARELRYRYQAPDRLRIVTEHGYELLRGPQGDYLIDPKRNEKGRLPVGREGDQDRRTLGEIMDLARNFVALSDPGSLRLAELAPGRLDLELLPEPLRASAQGLRWIELRTPDFRLPRESPPPAGTLVRVQLGLDPAKSLPALCIVGPDVAGPGQPRRTLIVARDYREKQGLVVPWNLAIHALGEDGRQFQPKAALEVWLRQSSDLHPSFTPETFAP